MRAFLITIKQREEADERDGVKWRVTHLRAIAKCSADAVLGVIDRLPFGAFVKVTPLEK